MSIICFIRDLITGRMSQPVSAWFTVDFDESAVWLSARPPGRKPWAQSFRWSDIERVCFKAEGTSTSDTIYVFTRLRPERFAVPTEAHGGAELWAEIIRRGHFGAELAFKAASSPSGAFWWPSEPTLTRANDR